MGENSIDIVNARDISLTGVGVYVPHGFEGDESAVEVELVITLPGARPFLARGLIRHVTDATQESSHFGVEFRGLADGHRRQIRDYIEVLRHR